LTLESPHHQRQHWIVTRRQRHETRQSSVSRFVSVWLKSLSLDVMNVRSFWSAQPCSYASLSEPTPHGIDLKKPFTMSNIGKRALTASLLVSTTRISVLFINTG
ncbi:hypothetical protein, partial [Sphingomonas lacusdianchii]|uniref:hypothetical protein n=1 Tax=Sphingomonas lacusdianchii TaxID=2917992 RepID=UPI001F59229B